MELLSSFSFQTDAFAHLFLMAQKIPRNMSVCIGNPKMTVITTALLAKLRAELREVMDEAQSLAEAAPFRRRPDAACEIVATLSPGVQQVSQLKALSTRLRRWGRITDALIRRYAIALPSPLAPILQLAEVYVRLGRTTPPDMTEGRWRAQFRDELTRVRLELEEVLELCTRTIPSTDGTAARSVVTIDVGIEERRGGRFRIRIRWRDRQLDQDVPFPFTRAEWDAVVDRRGRPAPTIDELPSLAKFGRLLFQLLFGGTCSALYDDATSAADAENASLCIRLDLADAGLIAVAPWELLHDDNGFIGVRRGVAITRTIAAAARPRTTGRPIKVLVTVSTPRTLRSLDTERELNLLQSALGGLELLERVHIDIAPDGTLDALRRCLRRAEDAGRPYDAWHFIGHGRFNEEARRGELAMMKDDGSHRFVIGMELETLFGDLPPKLIVLNACETALGAISEPRAGLAPTFIRCGSEHVIAMQFGISDAAAILLTEEAYGSLAAGADLVAAMADARRAIFCRPNTVEWMTPVVFLRTDPYTNSS